MAEVKEGGVEGEGEAGEGVSLEMVDVSLGREGAKEDLPAVTDPKETGEHPEASVGALEVDHAEEAEVETRSSTSLRKPSLHWDKKIRQCEENEIKSRQLTL